MKKLVYILSIAIGLVVTGCAQWEDFESLAPDTWGPVPELAIALDSTCLDADGSLTKDFLPLRITTKHATLAGYIVSTTPAGDEIDYTALLQGAYGNFVAEVDSAGGVIEHNLSGVTPGNTYYIYAVAANNAGVQSNAMCAVGAIDVDAPQPLTNPQLTATQGGKRAVIGFNENILRDETMGAIKYQVYNIDTNELVEEGLVADATASAANLTVTLPAATEFADDVNYIVVLSFEEGAVTDLYGNKMAAIQGVYNVDEMQVETGYWWLVVPGNTNPDEFFHDGDYYFDVVLTFDGQEWLEGQIPFTLSWVSDNYDMGNIFQNAPFTGTRWEVGEFLSNMLNGATGQAIPAFTYEYAGQDGLTYQYVTMIDPENGYIPCIGTVDLQGTTYDVFLADLEDQSLNPYWDFVVLDENDNPDGPVADLRGWYSLNTPIFVINQGTDAQPSYAIIVQFDSVVITPEGGVQAGSVKVFEEPIVLENVKMNTVSLEKKISLKK